MRSSSSARWWREDLPSTARLNFDGESREFFRSGNQMYFMFLLALVVVFLVLAAQFESFLHPFVIMTTVPLAVIGALLGLWMYGMSINVFSQIAAIMLVGLAAKNGILIVEFANQLRDRGLDYREAVIEAAAIRLRPVLMTSLCTAFGALPLMRGERRGRGGPPVDRRGDLLRRDDLRVPDPGGGAGRVHAGRPQHPVAADHRQADRPPARLAAGGRCPSRTRRRTSPGRVKLKS